MSLKPGYKDTEVGVIPEGWGVESLGALVTFRTGPFGSALHKSDYTKDGIPIINPMHIVEGKIEPTRTMTITEQAARNLSDFRVRPGEIVIGRRGDMGRCAVVHEHQSGWLCGTGSMIIRSHDTDSSFLQRVLSSPRAVAAIEGSSVGTTMVNLNQSTLSELMIQSPPNAEQRAIAEALSDVDALIGSLDRLLAKKRDLKQAAMQELLTGKTRLPGFHGEWETHNLGSLFDFSGGHTASWADMSEEGHCYLHYGDIHGSTKTFVDVRADFLEIPKLNIPLNRVNPRCLLADGDIVFVDASEDAEGTSKHVVIENPDNIPFISGLHTIVAKSKSTTLDNSFKRFCFQGRSVKEQFLFFAVGTKVSGISKSNIAKICLVVPPFAEQSAIAAILSDMDAEIAALEARRDKTRALKQGMMQELLTGRTRLV